MARFCGKCGRKLDEDTALCPNCDVDKQNEKNESTESVEAPQPRRDMIPKTEKPLNKKEAKKQHKAAKKAAKIAKKKEKWDKMTLGQKIKRFFVRLIAFVLALAIVLCAGACALVYFDVVDIPLLEKVIQQLKFDNKKADGLSVTIDDLKEIDPGAEIRNQSQVLETIEVDSSKQVLSEKNVVAQFTERGFTGLDVSTTYDTDGTYFDEMKVDENSTELHPLYCAVYISSSGYYWNILCCNGEWFATPISYLYSGKAECEIIVSENDYIMSYDSLTNCFYKLIPDKSQCVIKRIPNITPDALDELEEKEYGIS